MSHEFLLLFPCVLNKRAERKNCLIFQIFSPLLLHHHHQTTHLSELQIYYLQTLRLPNTSQKKLSLLNIGSKQNFECGVMIKNVFIKHISGNGDLNEYIFIFKRDSLDEFQAWSHTMTLPNSYTMVSILWKSFFFSCVFPFDPYSKNCNFSDALTNRLVLTEQIVEETEEQTKKIFFRR